jgi:hypothetical protein
VAAAPRTCASHPPTCGAKGASSLRQVTTTRTEPGRAARLKKVRKSKVSLSAQCTSSTTTPAPAADPSATAASSCATAANSRSRCQPSPGPSGPRPPMGPSCGTSRPTSARTNSGSVPSAASTRRPPSSPASSPSAEATGSSGSVPATGRHSPRASTVPAAAARAMPSATSRVLPTPASPVTSTSRVSRPSVPIRRDSSLSRPTKSTGTAMCQAHQAATARSIPAPWRSAIGRRPIRQSGAGPGRSRRDCHLSSQHLLPSWCANHDVKAGWGGELMGLPVRWRLLRRRPADGVCRRCGNGHLLMSPLWQRRQTAKRPGRPLSSLWSHGPFGRLSHHDRPRLNGGCAG